MISYLLVIASVGQVAAANVRPQIGYVYPPGGKAGTVVDVRIGTYDWTPDMQIYSHDKRVKIEFTGPPSEPILAPPPYWFGQKAGQAQPPLPREIPAKITLPADVPLGVVKWQVANANGGSNVNSFAVTDTAEIVEPEISSGKITLPALPVSVSGRLAKITEIDTYEFTVATAGLVVCKLDDRVGQPFSGALTIRDAAGKVLGDMADTTGDGAVVRFMASANSTYTASVNDVDFAGDRGYVYRLTVARTPQLVTSLPLVLKRGEKSTVEFLGWGLSTGGNKLESVSQIVTVPANHTDDSFVHHFDTPHGKVAATLLLGDAADTLEPTSIDVAARHLTVPSAISGTFERVDVESGMPIDRYRFTAKKGDSLRILCEAARFNSSADPSLVVFADDGKEIIRNDDLPTSVDAAVDFKAPADGVYDIWVSDVAGNQPSRANVYRLSIENPAEVADFALSIPDRFDIPLGGKADLIVRVARRGEWTDPIELRMENLPEGVEQFIEPVAETPPMPMPPAKNAKPKPAPKPKKGAPGKGDLKFTITASDKAASTASLAMLIGTATIGEKTIERRVGPVLITSTLKTRCKVKSAVQDGGRIVNRGTTYPADVIIERLEGYEGPVLLQMAAAQQRQRRGIRGYEVNVPAGVDQIQYPVFMPEWLETSLTARINVIGVVQVPDPQGNIRHVTGIMDGLIVMSLEGALMKLSHEAHELTARVGSEISIPIRVSRSVKLPESAKIELVASDDLGGMITADSFVLPVKQSTAIVKLRLANDPKLVGNRQVTFRATAMQNGKWPTVSETTVPIRIEPSNTVATAK